MNLSMKNGKITINGKDFVGRNISINGDKVTIDGDQQEGSLVGDVNIVVHGDVERIENEKGVVNANSVGSIKTMSGDVKCGEVAGSVSTMSGDVTCGNIGGSVSTMSGDIRNK